VEEIRPETSWGFRKNAPAGHQGHGIKVVIDRVTGLWMAVPKLNSKTVRGVPRACKNGSNWERANDSSSAEK